MPGLGRVGTEGPGRDGGFALVVVVWGLGLVTLLGTMAIVGARYRARDVGGLAAVARAAADAESGVALGILRAMAADPPLRRPVPFRCALPDGSTVRVLVAREAGKVDLNAAPAPLLARLFTGLTRDAARGAAVAAAVVAYRDPPGRALDPGVAAAYRADGKPEGPKRAPFVTPLELDQVPGVTPDLLAAALPAVTVLSGRPEPDPEAAEPALLALLGPRPAGAAALAGPPPNSPGLPPGPVTVRAEARTRDGARASREALVTFEAGGPPYRIAEWRRDTLAPGDAAAADDRADDGPARPCLRQWSDPNG